MGVRTYIEGDLKVEVVGFRETFCSNVRRSRQDAGLSVTELSKQSGISVYMLMKLEKGIVPKRMTIDDAFALAEVFHCETYELFE